MQQHNTSSTQPSLAACCDPQRSPLVRTLRLKKPPGVLTAIWESFSAFAALQLTKRGRKNSIREKLQGEQCSIEGILTHNKQCQHVWGAHGKTDTESAKDRKDCFHVGRQTERATVLFCRIREGFGLFSGVAGKHFRGTR